MKKLNFVMMGLCVFFLMSHSVYGRDLIQNKGSDTLVNVAQAWAEAYQTVNSNVAVAVTGGGSGTCIAALINGTVNIANASRKMKDKEIKMAEERSVWLNAGKIKNHHIVFSGMKHSLSVFTSINGNLVPLTYSGEELLKIVNIQELNR